MEEKRTSFQTIYDYFFTTTTEDMYLEMTRLDTEKDIQDILICAIPRFEFPRFNIFNYELGKQVISEDENGNTTVSWDGGYFIGAELTPDEIKVLSLCMKEEWFERQYATTDLAKMKYTGSDFKMSSQANHMSKLVVLKKETHADNIHQQRLYKRRLLGEDGRIRSTMGQIMTTPSYGYQLGGIKYDN